jgi:hypothetical protein
MKVREVIGDAYDWLPDGIQAIVIMVMGFAIFLGIGVGIYYLFSLKPMFLLLWVALAFVGSQPTGETIIIIIKG